MGQGAASACRSAPAERIPGSAGVRTALVLGRRVFSAGALLAVVLVLNFALIRLAPGDPALALAGGMGGSTEAILRDIRETHRLDDPLHVQLLAYGQRVLSGDLGHSLFFNAPVLDLIMARLGPTVLLVLSALGVALTLGTVLGVLASRRPGGIASHLVTVVSLAGFCAPVFWTGLLLLLLFSATVPLFPLSGMYDVRVERAGFAHALDVAHHLVLPALTLAIGSLAPYVRLARASMLEVLGADYIRTARAKGVSERAVRYRHALRNALLPVVTLTGVQFANLISGAVLVEAVFNWPGLGQLAFESVLRRDHPTLLGILLFATAMVVAANLLTDMAYRLVDPRIRHAGAVDPHCA